MNLLAQLVRGLDGLLRRRQAIFEFSQAQDCLLRLAIRPSPRPLRLADGTCIRHRDPVGELHLWNEHIPPIPTSGPDLAWALGFQRRLRASFVTLADYLERAPSLDGIRAFRGEDSFGSWYSQQHMGDILARWGFELIGRPSRPGARQRFAEFWGNLYALALIWAYNPASLCGRRLRELRRDEIWISRGTLIAKYRRGDKPRRI